MSFISPKNKLNFVIKQGFFVTSLTLALGACSESSTTTSSETKPAVQASTTTQQQPVVMAYGRHAPERVDDFTWENDKVAFRVYGPAASTTGISSGVDAWLKKVDYSIIDKWYAGHLQGISYHEDKGEGYDPYHTGDSRGVGGTAIWIDGKPYAAKNWLTYDVHENKGEAVSFTLTYEVETPLGKVEEAKTITLKLGEQLYHVNSSYKLNGKPAKLPVAIGLTTHDENATVYQDKATGRISAWEKIHDYGLAVGAIIDPALVEGIKHLPSEEKDKSHIWLFTSTDSEGHLEFKAGFGWQGAGEINSIDEWNTYLDKLSTSYQW